MSRIRQRNKRERHVAKQLVMLQAYGEKGDREGGREGESGKGKEAGE